MLTGSTPSTEFCQALRTHFFCGPPAFGRLALPLWPDQYFSKRRWVAEVGMFHSVVDQYSLH